MTSVGKTETFTPFGDDAPERFRIFGVVVREHGGRCGLRGDFNRALDTIQEARLHFPLLIMAWKIVPPSCQPGV